MTGFQKVIAGLVTSVWVSVYAKFIAGGKEPPTEITVPFLLILGWVSGGKIRGQRPNEDPPDPLLTRLLDAMRPAANPPKDSSDDPPKGT